MTVHTANGSSPKAYELVRHSFPQTVLSPEHIMTLAETRTNTPLITQDDVWELSTESTTTSTLDESGLLPPRKWQAG